MFVMTAHVELYVQYTLFAERSTVAGSALTVESIVFVDARAAVDTRQTVALVWTTETTEYTDHAIYCIVLLIKIMSEFTEVQLALFCSSIL